MLIHSEGLFIIFLFLILIKVFGVLLILFFIEAWGIFIKLGYFFL